MAHQQHKGLLIRALVMKGISMHAVQDVLERLELTVILRISNRYQKEQSSSDEIPTTTWL